MKFINMLHSPIVNMIFPMFVIFCCIMSFVSCSDSQTLQAEPVPVTEVNNIPKISYIKVSSEVTIGSISRLECVALDVDNDSLSYMWKATGGTLIGSGASLDWKAPSEIGIYTITVSVSDGKGGRDERSTDIRVVDRPNSTPVIKSFIVIKEDKIPIEIIAGQQTKSISMAKWQSAIIECVAEDADGDPISYLWSSSEGVIEGAGNKIKFTSEGVTGDMVVVVTVVDSKGAKSKASVNFYVPCCGEGSFGQSGT